MINGIEQEIDDHLKDVFERGYYNSLSALRQIVQGKIDYAPLYKSLYRFETDPASILGFVNRSAEGVLITTEVFGDIFGKSYLLLSHKEFDSITKGICGDHDPAINLKEEFIKELDNILSAAVVTKLSDELKLKIYGDIPILTKSFSGDLFSHIRLDFASECDEVYINSIAFTFENCAYIRPRFVWVMDNRIVNVPQPKRFQ